MIEGTQCRIARAAAPRYGNFVADRSSKSFAVRALLALTIAYVLILQGIFANAAAGTHIATAVEATGIARTLCSGAQAPGDAAPDENGHHGAAQSSCCTWGAALALDPGVPPASPTVYSPYRAPASHPVAVGQIKQVAILYRVATTQGSRAPPELAA